MKIEELIENSSLSRKIIKKVLFVIAFAIALVFALFNLDRLLQMGGYTMGLFSPFLMGIAVAFVLNVLLKTFENKIFAGLNKKNFKIWNRCRRGVCIVLSFLVLFAIISGIIFFVIPEIISSMKILADNAPSYVHQFSEMATNLMEELNITSEYINQIKIDWPSIFSHITQFTTDFMSSLINGIVNFASGIVTLVLSLIFSVYMLAEKEKISKNLKKVLYAYLPKPKAKGIIRVASLSHRIFSGFVTGQLVEALIIGVLCYIGMSIIQLPYALLISSVISITAVIPILGAYLGAAIGAFILLLIDPKFALWFLVFIILLQQFESNVIYPKVVGSSVGLPGIWVLLAVLVSGELFGILGILLGVPAFSVIYTLLKRDTVSRLRLRQITEEDLSEKIEDSE